MSPLPGLRSLSLFLLLQFLNRPEEMATNFVVPPCACVGVLMNDYTGTKRAQPGNGELGERDYWRISGPLDFKRNWHCQIVITVFDPGLEHPEVPFFQLDGAQNPVFILRKLVLFFA